MYAYRDNLLSIPARYLYEDWEVMSYENYKWKCRAGKLIRTAVGKGLGNEAYVSFWDLPTKWQRLAVEAWGDPRELILENELERYLLPDPGAVRFFAQHRRPGGLGLSMEKQREKVANCQVMLGIKAVLSDRANRVWGGKTMKIWQNISAAVQALDARKYPQNLPSHARKLRQKYEDYLAYGMGVFIHRGEGSQNALKISAAVATGWWRPMRCLSS